MYTLLDRVLTKNYVESMTFVRKVNKNSAIKQKIKVQIDAKVNLSHGYDKENCCFVAVL